MTEGRPTIADVGWSLPRMVHDGTRVPSFDEDATTLAVAAGRTVGLEDLPETATLAMLGEADAGTVAAATGFAGDVERAEDLSAAFEAAGADGAVVEADAPRRGPAFGVAVRTGPPGEGDDPPAALDALLPDDAGAFDDPAAVEADGATVDRHVEAFETTPDERTPMGAFVSPQTYRESLDARYRLVGRRCVEGHVSFPPQPKCPACGADEMAPEPLSGRGRIHAVTVIGEGAAPAEFTSQNQALGTYAVAIVALDEGPRIVAQVADADPDAVRIDDPVEAVFRRIYVQRDGVRYGTKFRPVPG